MKKSVVVFSSKRQRSHRGHKGPTRQFRTSPTRTVGQQYAVTFPTSGDGDGPGLAQAFGGGHDGHHCLDGHPFDRLIPQEELRAEQAKYPGE
ncbi:MAG: hypothetical protein AAB602_01495 [Patescibacteria group bacterium]